MKEHLKGVNVKNLKRMAKHLKTVPEEQFGMRFFMINTSCGSSGCIIGHCTVLDDKDNIPMTQGGDIDYWGWSQQFTGIDIKSPSWDFLFSHKWMVNDNTKEGAIKRINHFIKNGVPERNLIEIKNRRERYSIMY